MTSEERDRIDRLIGQYEELLVGMGDLKASQCALDARDKERENTRVLLRARDDEWRHKADAKFDGVFLRLDQIADSVDGIPKCVDSKVAAAIASHEQVTVGSRRLWTNFAIMLVAVVIFAVVATLEFYDKEDTAGFALVALSCASVLILPVLNRLWK